MKKIPITVETKGLCLLFVLIALCGHVKSQGILPEGYKHIIEVKRYSDWGKGYLTIIDDGSIGVKKSSTYFADYRLTYEPVGDTTVLLQNGDLVIEVDGKLAEGWSEERFYKAIDGRKDTIRLKVRQKTWADSEFTIPIINDVDIWIHPTNDVSLKGFLPSIKKYGRSIKAILDDDKEVTWITRTDKDFDFFYVLYYDYAINSSDPLFDKELLEGMEFELHYWSHMVRREENPDIIFTVAKSADESISTTYIPPSSRTVYTGSTTTANYGVATGRYLGSTTRQNSYTVREGGYTKETKTADLYLEITALDAKKINDPKQTYPPIVWQTIAKRHLTNYNFDVEDELKAYVTWIYFPIEERRVRRFEKIAYESLGIVAKLDNHIIDSVCPGMLAEKIGLRSGDKLVQVECEFVSKKNMKKSIKQYGWNSIYLQFNKYSERYAPACLIVVIRNGEKITFTVKPEKLTYVHTYYL